MHFDEVFLTDVFVPSDSVLPPAGAGWRIASAMLHHQRIARATGQRGGVRHDRTDRLRDECRRRALTEPVVRDALVRLYIAEVCQSLLVSRSLSTAATPGADPGPIGSLGKLTNALVARQFADLAWRIVGADALAWAGPPLGQPGTIEPGARWAADALFTLSLSIAGGTNEIQRSIIAERVLGLPREPAVADPGHPAGRAQCAVGISQAWSTSMRSWRIGLAWAPADHDGNTDEYSPPPPATSTST